LVLERWSRGSSPLHSRDARAKIAVLILFLVAVSTSRSMVVFACYGAMVIAAILIARLPLAAILIRTLTILPFVAPFTLLTWVAGQPERALAILEKSFLSAAATLVLMATTPVYTLLRGMASIGVPRILVLVIQFLYRYLFVITEQAQHMMMAARSRGSRFHSAAGAIGVLFVRSWERAEGIYSAMLARGFAGRFVTMSPARFAAMDVLFCAATTVAIVGIRLAL
jgi:cobalt/nickel transport system permease protein